MADFVNTRDTMPGRTDDERARQTFDKLIAHELTEFKEDAVDWVRQYAFRNNKTLVNVELPTIEYNSTSNRNNYMFQDCTALKNIKLKGMTRTPRYAFYGCTALESVEMSDNLNYIDENFLYNCSLTIFDTKNTSDTTFTVASYAFYGSQIVHFILRSNIVATLSNINAFIGTPIFMGEGAIYVPASLLDSYKSATNWKIMADNIFPIEEVGGEIVLRTTFDTIDDTWEQILDAEQDGSYSTKYHIGDTKTVSIDGVNVKMKIAAFDADTIADSTEKAKISWVCTKSYNEPQPMNTDRYTTGGWPAMPIYTYLNDTSDGVYSKIESTVKDAIKTVVKPYWDAAASAEETSNDNLWLLSAQEVNFIADGFPGEKNGVTYSGLFPDKHPGNSTNRIKYDNLGNTINWWLRSSISPYTFMLVDFNGAFAAGLSDEMGVVFGFCT